ncbi:MAG: FtsW/RodA/SpoVE family cell cycle protein [Candidatus Adlerbacteria bacterium]|nr:FtsW/RodA/SpoVE family cell cycle protein [Candidatus Adlerbacteria bacterium]
MFLGMFVSAGWLKKIRSIDWVIFSCAVTLSALGLLTMNSFTGQDPLFIRQLVWLGLGTLVFFGASFIDWRFLRRSGVAASIYGLLIVPLLLLLVLGRAVKGAKSWIAFGGLGIEPVEFVKLALIIALAKYFSRRHIEIHNIRHVIVSGFYAAFVFFLVALQPDFGGAIIIFLVWFGMVFFSGISKKHVATVVLLGLTLFAGLWLFGFHDYQKQRILNFVHPARDVQGTGYNAYQSMVAVGSGELFGKGIGYGTQSKLRFLPEYQTDFIFAAFAEEWGFVGILFVFLLFGILFWRIIQTAARGATNFETLFALGVLCYLAAHFTLHAGINLGILPVTGTTIPFMSYGGSHMLGEFLALGMLSGMRRYARAAHRDMLDREFSGGYDR